MKKQILLVDDKPTGLIVFEEFLSNSNIICLRANSAKEALSLLEETEISLILLDIKVPGLSSFDTLKLIYENKTWDNIPIILTSEGRISEAIQLKGIKLGAIDYITKPIIPELLLGKINTYLELYEYRKEQNIKIAKTSTRNDGLVNERTHELKLKNKQLLIEKKERKAAINIINASPVIAFRWANTEGLPLQYVSENVKGISGYTVNELLSGKVTIFDIVHKDDIERVKEELVNFSKEKDTTTFAHKPYRIHKKNGDIIWVDERIIIIRSSKGYITHFQGIIIDITEMKKAEAEMQKLNTAFEQTSSSIIITDIQGNIEYVNPYFCKLTGYSEEEAIGKNPRILKSGDTCTLEYLKLWSTISSGKTWSGEFLNIKKNGEKYWESAIIAPVFDDNKKIINYIGLKQDITKTVIAQKELEESEKRYRSLIQDNHSVMMVVDIKTKKVIEANNACCSFYGYSREEMLKLNVSQINTLSIDEIEIKIQNAVSNKENRFEFKHKLANGDFTDVEVYTGIVKYGNTDALLSVIHDITDKIKTANELIIAKEKAIESDRLKTAFLANMSHEIRTPMNAILGFSQLLALPDISQDDTTSYVDTITNSGKQLLSLIDDIISISQIEAGIIDVFLKNTPIEKLLKTTYKLFLITARKTNILFSYKNELEDEDRTIYSDSRRIQQVLINLISNAFKFTDEGSIEFGCRKNNSNIEFYVSDTGIGITKEDQKIIFDRFMQVDHGSDVLYGGTGIGLSISKAIVEKLGGKIWVNSKQKKGTTFCFSIPIIKQQEKVTKIAINTEAPNLEGKVILVAEDEDNNYELINILLSKAGAKVIRAKNGNEAVAIFKKTKNLDLIFMDIKMPSIDGLDATMKIRKYSKTIPIIAQTAYAQTGDRSTAINAGCNDYITKPILKNVLFDILRKYI